MAPVLFGTSSTMLVISGTVGATSTTIGKTAGGRANVACRVGAVTVNIMRVPSFNPVVGVKLHAPLALAGDAKQSVAIIDTDPLPASAVPFSVGRLSLVI